MADFLLLFRRPPGREPDFSPEVTQQQLQKWQAWIAEISKSGVVKAGDPLKGEGRQLLGKSRRVVDGPFTEAKDLVGGYFIVQARDLDHATELARGCPVLDYDGKVEIRPIQEKEM